MDFAKAFDKVPHKRLLYKLKYYGTDTNTQHLSGWNCISQSFSHFAAGQDLLVVCVSLSSLITCNRFHNTSSHEHAYRTQMATITTEKNKNTPHILLQNIHHLVAIYPRAGVMESIAGVSGRSALDHFQFTDVRFGTRVPDTATAL
jgi:hypothetical protein